MKRYYVSCESIVRGPYTKDIAEGWAYVWNTDGEHDHCGRHIVVTGLRRKLQAYRYKLAMRLAVKKYANYSKGQTERLF